VTNNYVIHSVFIETLRSHGYWQPLTICMLLRCQWYYEKWKCFITFPLAASQ